MGNAYATAFKLLTLGFSVIPSGGGDKHKAPLVKWREYEDTAPDESQLRHKSAVMTMRYLKTLSADESLKIQQTVDFQW